MGLMSNTSKQSGSRYCRGSRLQVREGSQVVYFLRIIITPLPRPRPDLRECVASMNFQELLVFFCLAGLAGGSPIENLIPTFVVFKKSFFLKQYGDL